MLELRDRVRRPHVLLAADAVVVLAARVEARREHGVRAERHGVQARGFAGDLEEPDALDDAGGAGEVLVDERLAQADRLEDLRAAIALVGRDAHLGHHLVEPLADRLHVLLLRVLRLDVADRRAGCGERLEREVRVDRLGAVACEQREVVHLARRPGLDDEPGGRAHPQLDQVLVHGGGREQRGNRQAVGADLAVGQDQDVLPLRDRVDRVRRQARERGLHAVRAPCRRVADVELLGVERAAREELDVPELLHVLGGEDRLLDLEPHRRLGDAGLVVDREQVRARPDERHEAHHQLLADRVDRRVGDLREQLLEVVVEDLGPVGKHRQRGVVAHRADRLLAGLRHRREDHLEVFLRPAERLLAVQERHLGGLRGRGLGHRLERQAAAVEPVAVRLRRRERALELLVVDDPPRLEVDEQHPAGLQAPLLDDLLLGDVEHADFRGHHDQVVVGHDEARGTQPVAVERRADLAAVRERHRRRAVPGLHQRRVVLVERAAVVVHQRVAGPRLGNHHHHRVGRRVAAHHEELERVVERGRVGLALVDQREQLRQVVAEHDRRDRAFARADPVEVAAQRVDLAVVADVPERVREVPGRERVGREALVDHRERRDHRLVGEVEVELADLVREQHALVAERARRERRHVELLAVLEGQRLDRVPGALADHVELALEGGLVHLARAAPDEHLTDDGLDLLGALGQPLVARRDVAPAEQHLPFRGDRALDLLLAGRPRGRLLGQEHHADAVLPDRRQRDAELAARAAQECVGELDQDARAVALQRVGARGPPMRQVFEDPEALGDDRVAFLALDVRDEAQAARVVLVRGVVHALARRRPRAQRPPNLLLGSVVHHRVLS